MTVFGRKRREMTYTTSRYILGVLAALGAATGAYLLGQVEHMTYANAALIVVSAGGVLYGFMAS